MFTRFKSFIGFGPAVPPVPPVVVNQFDGCSNPDADGLVTLTKISQYNPFYNFRFAIREVADSLDPSDPRKAFLLANIDIADKMQVIYGDLAFYPACKPLKADGTVDGKARGMAETNALPDHDRNGVELMRTGVEASARFRMFDPK